MASMLSTYNHTYILWNHGPSDPLWVRRTSRWTLNTQTGKRVRLGLQKVKQLTRGRGDPRQGSLILEAREGTRNS